MKNFKEIVKSAPFIIAIALLVNLFTYQALSMVFESPQYDDFCGSRDYAREYDENSCIAVGGEWYSYEDTLTPETVIDEQVADPEDRVTGHCDPNFTCAAQWNEANEQHSEAMFIALLVAGAVSLLAAWLISASIISLGFSYGGVFLLLGSLGHLWQVSGQLVQLIVIAALLGVIGFIGQRKFGQEEGKEE